MLVHGAFADASGWNDLAVRLIRDAHIHEVRAPHAAMISKPAATADLIERAAARGS
ncbi:hypothetical protein ABGB07_35300 [Micromonosporaceae bacterium B7E4]